MTIAIAFTGHRPGDLHGVAFQTFAAALDKLGVGKRTDLTFITGGALGVDSWAASYAMTRDIPFDLYLPFPPEVMAARWSDAAQVGLQTHMNVARKVTILSATYDVRTYQERNIAMVDNADKVFAVWTGKRHGGTANCVRYALSQGRPLYNLYPLDGRLREITGI